MFFTSGIFNAAIPITITLLFMIDVLRRCE